MLRRGVDELTIIELDRQESRVHVDKVREILYKKPTDVVYFVYDNLLYGLICTGDILRKNKDGYIPINKNFTSLDSWDSKRARAIFSTRSNIHKIPVTNGRNILVGDYSAWNYDLSLELYIRHMSLEDIKELNAHICLVEPLNSQIDQQKCYTQMRIKFDKLRVDYELCNKNNLLEKIHNNACLFLVADQDEKMKLMGIGGTFSLNREKSIFTYSDILKLNEEKRFKKVNGIIMKRLVSQLEDQGILCYELSYPLEGKNREYIVKCEQEISKRLEHVYGMERIKIREEMAKDFFTDIYTDDYWREIRNLPGNQQWVNGVLKLKDATSKYFNSFGGERKTIGQPQKYIGTVYCIGPCDICGRWVEDKYTIASYMQSKLNGAGYRYRVVNLGIWAGNRHSVHNIINVIGTLNLYKGDIIIFSLEPEESFAMGKRAVDYYDIIEKNQIPSTYFVDGMGHHNHKVNEILADNLLRLIEPKLETGLQRDIKLSALVHTNDIMKEYVKLGYIDYYFSEFNCSLYNRIGAVVVCCNPFTRGHRYLLETAARKVDFLFIFVVEENSMAFSFEERFAMVCKGTSDLKNIMVVPSGRFLISQATFPEYFLKIMDEDIFQNVNYDVTLFADCIAQPLNIRYRFVGTEPNDAGTNAYNDSMKRILPDKGIELFEIMRKEYDDTCISASKVRAYLEEGNMDKAFEIVPETTRAFL